MVTGRRPAVVPWHGARFHRYLVGGVAMRRRKISAEKTIGRMKTTAGGLKQLLAGQTLILNGSPLKVDDLIAEIDSYIAQLGTTAKAHASWLAEVRTTRRAETQLSTRLAALHTYLAATLGAASPTLVHFGFEPRKPPKRTVRAKAVVVAKSLATRAQRHTMGPRQKAQIHGTVTPDDKPAE
jgi:hypothetical protein